MKKRKLILINAINPDTQRKSSYFEPRVLGIIAALTPENWEIVFIDQNIEEFRYQDADLVGITAFTSSIYEAYRISTIYKDKNIPVVIGGIHATILPNEVINYANSAIVGDAETTWPLIIDDFEQNALKNIYYGQKHDLFIAPKRTSYFNQYYSATIETSRGCPMNCDFCSVPAIFHGKYYTRPIDDIINEIKNYPGKNIFFSDDNMYGISKKDNERFKLICSEIIKNKIKKNWIGFASLNIANDSESLKLANQSGCKLLMIGFESEDIDILKSVNKTINLKFNSNQIHKLVKKIQSYHIGVIGGFIFGFDSDTEESISVRRNYINNLHLDIVSYVPLTPYPGTKLYLRLQNEHRLKYNSYPADWTYYNFNNFCSVHPKLDTESIKNIFISNRDELYSRKKVIKGLIISFLRTRNLKTVKHIYDFKSRG
jgi:radical SAM superfamily enzyme YgiQ (UPF0313 family)